VTNPEKMVLRGTQRAFVYFCLHGLTVDQMIVNRVLPDEITDPFFEGRRKPLIAKVLHRLPQFLLDVYVARMHKLEACFHFSSQFEDLTYPLILFDESSEL
jgi:anion-transporting  ArsA/GET3 family ATPase